MATGTHVTAAQAARVAAALAIDWDRVAFDLDQFRRGMAVELEHGRRDPQMDITHDDPLLTGKIALAHLRELPNYYTRLAAMERGTVED
jgi:hypothetical protein